MATLLRVKCKYCGSGVMKKSTDGKIPDAEPVCSRKRCVKNRRIDSNA